MELYKYTSWRPYDDKGKFAEKNHTKDNLLNHQLFFNSATSFNDPFDLYPAFEANYDARNILLRAQRAVEDREGLHGSKALARARQLIKERGLRGKEGRCAAIKRMRELLEKIGVCCFTLNSPETVLMWAHYGDHHKGICLIFDISEKGLEYLPPPEVVAGPNPVTYSENLPKINLFVDSVESWYGCMTTKSNEWKYEKEYRALTSTGYFGPIGYKPSLLKAVVAGCKMGFKELIELENTIKDMNPTPKFYRAVKKEEQYGLELKLCN